MSGTTDSGPDTEVLARNLVSCRRLVLVVHCGRKALHNVGVLDPLKIGRHRWQFFIYRVDESETFSASCLSGIGPLDLECFERVMYHVR